MNRRRFVLKLALLVAAVGMVVFALVRPAAREPEYRGRPLREWLVEFDHGQSSTNYAAAQEAIRAMGTNCLPFLIGYLRSKDPPFNRQRVSLKARLKLSARKGGEYAVFWHRRAATACGELGQAGGQAFPAMREAMNDPHTAESVAFALSRMLPKSAPVLTNALATGNATARYRSADALMTAYSHPEIEEMAQMALLKALEDPDPWMRASAAGALQFWNRRLDVVLPALTRALSDPNRTVRGNAAISLGNFGAAAKPAVPDLLKLLQDTNDYPREHASRALLKIDPEVAAKETGK